MNIQTFIYINYKIFIYICNLINYTFVNKNIPPTTAAPIAKSGTIFDNPDTVEPALVAMVDDNVCTCCCIPATLDVKLFKVLFVTAAVWLIVLFKVPVIEFVALFNVPVIDEPIPVIAPNCCACACKRFV